MMNKKETILLDARITAVIDKHAFNAELCNGHKIVAFFERADKGKCQVTVGEPVKVEISPYDMSKGRLIYEEVKL